MVKNVLSFLVLYFCTPAWVNAGTPETLSVKAKALPDYCYTNRNHPCWANAHPSNGLPGIPMDLNLGKGCRVAITLLNGEVNRVGGDPEMQMGGFNIEPLPKNWKSRLDSLGFNLYCKSSEDPDVLNTLGYLDAKNERWIKNERFMQKRLIESTSEYAKGYFREIIKVTKIYDVKTPNAHGWAETTEAITGDERGRRRTMSFCLPRPPKAICGGGVVGMLIDGPKGDLTQHALKIIKSIEFLPDVAPDVVPATTSNGGLRQ